MGTNKKRKMDQIVGIIRQQLSQGMQPQEVENYLVEQGLPQQTAETLIKMNLKPKEKPQPKPSSSSLPAPESTSEPEPAPEPTADSERFLPMLKSKSPLAREKAAIAFINHLVSQGAIQSEVVEALVENGIDQSEAISMVVKIIGVDN